MRLQDKGRYTPSCYVVYFLVLMRYINGFLWIHF